MLGLDHAVSGTKINGEIFGSLIYFSYISTVIECEC